MKPTSTVFLIVSAVIILAGLITMGVASGFAASEGIILTQSADESHSEIHEYSNLSKITLDLKDVEVNIIGNSDTAYVELVNFPMGMYTFSNTNRVLTIKNSMDIFSFSGFASMISGFKGLGGIVNYFNLADAEKAVNIYLSTENPLNIIECTLEEGNVNIKNCDIYADYDISIEKGKLSIDGLQTKSLVSAAIKDGNILVNDSNIKTLSAEISRGNLKIDGNIDTIDASVEIGDVTYNCYNDLGLINYKLTANVGKVIIDGADFGGYANKIYENIENLTDISVGTGNITLSSALGKNN